VWLRCPEGTLLNKIDKRRQTTVLHTACSPATGVLGRSHGRSPQAARALDGKVHSPHHRYHFVHCCCHCCCPRRRCPLRHSPPDQARRKKPLSVEGLAPAGPPEPSEGASRESGRSGPPATDVTPPPFRFPAAAGGRSRGTAVTGEDAPAAPPPTAVASGGATASSFLVVEVEAAAGGCRPLPLARARRRVRLPGGLAHGRGAPLLVVFSIPGVGAWPSWSLSILVMRVDRMEASFNTSARTGWWRGRLLAIGAEVGGDGGARGPLGGGGGGGADDIGGVMARRHAVSWVVSARAGSRGGWSTTRDHRRTASHA